MADSDGHTRRSYLELAGAAGAAGVTALAGCTTGGGNTTTTADDTSGEDTTTGDDGASDEGPIPMGSILPITGQLSDYGSGMQQAVKLAEQHVNDAGGPLGRELAVTTTDSETKPQVGQQKYNTLVDEEDIVGFVGAASSGVSTPLAQRVAQDGVMQVSNASTSPALATMGYDEDESTKYFARTAPNDAQQGEVMARILNQDQFVGADTAAFLYVDNAYGQGLAERAEEGFDGETVASVSYAAETTDYTSTLDEVFADDPDAVGFIGYPSNGRTILNQWSNGGYGGEWVLSEGLNSAEFFNELSDIVSGMYVASPDPESTDGATAFEEAMGDTAGTLFAPHAYDALFLMALAMHKAGEASAEAIANNIRSVSRPSGEGDEVVTVGEFDRAKQLIDEGTPINYQGASSPVDMNEALEPLNRFAVLQVNDDGSTSTETTIPRSEF